VAILLPDVSILNGIEEVTEVLANDRFGFTFNVTINDIDLNEIGYSSFIDSFSLEQTVNKIDLLKLRFINNDRIDDDLFAEGNKVSIHIGHDTTSVFDFGNFVVTKVNWNFGSNGDGVLLYCLGESVKLAYDQKRRSYEFLAHSDIVGQIALENKFKTDIDETIIIYESIIQANESNWSLVKRFADMNGYVFFVRNGILHFHKIRVSNSKNDHTNLLLDFSNPISNIIKSANIDVVWLGKNSAVTSTSIGQYTSVITTLSQTDQYDIDGVLNKNKSSDVRPSNEISKERKIFKLESGIDNSVSEIQKQLDSRKFFDNFVIKLRLVCDGVEDFVSGKLIEINGFDRFSGTYYISSVNHFSVGGLLGSVPKPYTTELVCWQKFSGSLANAQPETFEDNAIELQDVTNALDIQEDVIVR